MKRHVLLVFFYNVIDMLDNEFNFSSIRTGPQGFGTKEEEEEEVSLRIEKVIKKSPYQS